MTTYSLDSANNNVKQFFGPVESEPLYPLYQEFIKHHPAASAYHTLDWLRVIDHSYGRYSYKPYCITVGNAEQITGILLLFEHNGLLFGRRLIALPFSHYVPILYQDEEALRTLVIQGQHIARQRQCKYLEVRGSSEELARLGLGFQIATCYLMSRLDLRVEEKILYKQIRGETRSQIKQALKHGLVVKRGQSAADFATFERLSLETRRHQGTPPYPSQLFRELQTMPQARLYLARQGARFLAGKVVFCHGKYAINIYAASVKDQELLRTRPNDLLMWHVITELQAEGYETLDLGTSPITHKTLLHYKEKWGTRSEPIPYAYWLNTAKQVPMSKGASKNVSLIRAIIRWMPFWAVRLATGLRERL
jgi:Acetyltransferase (GNAT) domain